jgi:hypothetical protein
MGLGDVCRVVHAVDASASASLRRQLRPALAILEQKENLRPHWQLRQADRRQAGEGAGEVDSPNAGESSVKPLPRSADDSHREVPWQTLISRSITPRQGPSPRAQGIRWSKREYSVVLPPPPNQHLRLAPDTVPVPSALPRESIPTRHQLHLPSPSLFAAPGRRSVARHSPALLLRRIHHRSPCQRRPTTRSRTRRDAGGW